jgi:hypothetical protein
MRINFFLEKEWKVLLYPGSKPARYAHGRCWEEMLDRLIRGRHFETNDLRGNKYPTVVRCFHCKDQIDLSLERPSISHGPKGPLFFHDNEKKDCMFLAGVGRDASD